MRGPLGPPAVRLLLIRRAARGSDRSGRASASRIIRITGTVSAATSSILAIGEACRGQAAVTPRDVDRIRGARRVDLRRRRAGGVSRAGARRTPRRCRSSRASAACASWRPSRCRWPTTRRRRCRSRSICRSRRSRRRSCSTLASCRPGSTSATRPRGSPSITPSARCASRCRRRASCRSTSSASRPSTRTSGFLNAIAPEDRNRWYTEARSALEHGALAQGALDRAQIHAEELFEAFVARHGYTLVIGSGPVRRAAAADVDAGNREMTDAGAGRQKECPAMKLRLSAACAGGAVVVVGAAGHADARDKGKRQGKRRAARRASWQDRAATATAAALWWSPVAPAIGAIAQDHGGRRRRRASWRSTDPRRRQARADRGPSRRAAHEHDRGLQTDRARGATS